MPKNRLRGLTIWLLSGCSARCLIGVPTLGDYLEVGFATPGISCEEFEVGRL